MKVFPAIDIRDAKVVRLTYGDYERMEVYGDSPVAAARDFAARGAENLHVVDLDGAKDGELSNFDAIERIVRGSGMFIEVGGGIRDMKRIEKYLAVGVGRVILGTAAVRDPAFLREAVGRFGAQVAVGVDTKDGMIAVDGWQTVTERSGVDYCRELIDLGVKTVIYTDISRDGALGGTNLPLYERLSRLDGLDIVASGGVTALDEIRALRGMGIYGVIVGKALYTGALRIEEVLEAAR